MTPILSKTDDPPDAYEYFVDMEPYPVDLDGGKPCYRCTVSTHIPKHEISDFTNELIDRKVFAAFNMKMKVILTNQNRVWFTFIPWYAPPNEAPLTVSAARQGMIRLISYLCSRPYPVIWKEDKYGYTIEQSGRIKRRWSLLPF